MLSAILINFLFILSSGPENYYTQPQDNFLLEKNFSAGEELTYEVSYSFIKIGQIKIKIHEVNDKSLRASADIESYPGLPFKGLKEKIESTISTDGYSQKFKALHLGYDPPRFTEHLFDYKNDSVKVRKGIITPYKITTDSSRKIDSKLQDGLSLLYYARLNSGNVSSDTIDCFINEKIVNTMIEFTDDVELVEIMKVEYPIDCVELSGYSDFVGLYGLTGDFYGWFSNDSYSIPIVARLNVFIGSVKIELIEWNVNNWQPPRYVKSEAE